MGLGLGLGLGLARRHLAVDQLHNLLPISAISRELGTISRELVPISCELALGCGEGEVA